MCEIKIKNKSLTKKQMAQVTALLQNSNVTLEKKKFAGKNVLVIGGTSGIGAASAIKLAEEGAAVAVVGRDVARGHAVLNALHRFNSKSIYISADVTNFMQVDNMFKVVISKFKNIDCVFNCAGVLGNDTVLCGNAFHESSEENWNLVMNTNVKAVWYCMKHELKHMSNNKHGVILNNSSVAGLKAANSKSASYTASKHAVIGLTKATAYEYATCGIRINAICPGIIDTPFLKNIPQIKNHYNLISPQFAGDSQHMQNYRGGSFNLRMGTPEEVASVVVFLLSDDASYINGSAVVVDAGGLFGVV